MSKRPIVYEIFDNYDGHVYYEFADRQEALETMKQMITNEPGIENELTFAVTRPNGKTFTVLFSVTGKALIEFLDAELEDDFAY
jgi:hypothetical protein